MREGQITNGYEILGKLGEGNFGKVFKAKNKSNEEVAIKIQYKDIQNVLKQEAKIYNYLKNLKGIPKLRNYGVELGYSYLVLDKLGPSLHDIKVTKSERFRFVSAFLE